ncbi:MAG: hypothetical protein HC802_17775 [Caldilineaceae bacterium]|nr:hypothetical protein [Caldilineaceae bacterium]
MQEKSVLFEFVGIGELAETTTHLLSLNLKQSAHVQRDEPKSLDQVEQIVLQQARDYLNTVREGFVLSVRSSQLSDRLELRFLLNRVLTDWKSLSQELGFEENESQPGEAGADDPAEVKKIRHQLLAFGMAVVALGYLPRLPSKEITFPHSYGNPPTYADIPVPQSPGEMLWRIEEIEQTIWQVMANHPHEMVQRHYGQLRRTYGFFEASASLSRQESKRFGVKKRHTTLGLL